MASIGGSAFSGCSGVKTIRSARTAPPTLGEKVFDGIDKQQCVVQIPKGQSVLNAYFSAPQWGAFMKYEQVEFPASVYIATVKFNTGGAVKLNGAAVADGSQTEVTAGAKLELRVMPMAGYRLGSVLLNGADITAQLTDNSYTVDRVEDVMDAVVAFVKEPFDPSAATLKVVKQVLVSGSSPVLTLALENSFAVKGFQAEFTFPDGISPRAYAVRTAQRTQGWSISAGMKNGRLVVVGYSQQGYGMTAGSGSIAEIPVDVALAASENPVTIRLDNVVLTDVDGVTAAVNAVDFVTTVVAFKLGDSNEDGAVNVSDAVNVVNYIVGAPPAVFSFRASDVNSDELINVTDVVGIVNIILSPSGSSSALRSVNAPMAYTLDGGRFSIHQINASPNHQRIRGFDFAYSGELTATDLLNGFSVVKYEKDGQQRVLAYTMGSGVSGGVLFTGVASVSDLLFVDATGAPIEMSLVTPTGLPLTPSEGGIKVFGTRGAVVMEGATTGTAYIVYSLTGTQVATGTIADSRTTVALPAGIYVVAVGTQRVKVVVP